MGDSSWCYPDPTGLGSETACLEIYMRTAVLAESPPAVSHPVTTDHGPCRTWSLESTRVTTTCHRGLGCRTLLWHFAVVLQDRNNTQRRNETVFHRPYRNDHVVPPFYHAPEHALGLCWRCQAVAARPVRQIGTGQRRPGLDRTKNLFFARYAALVLFARITLPSINQKPKRQLCHLYASPFL